MTKTFIPLECNPDVFNKMMYAMGVSREVAFHDVFSTDPELLAMLPRPVYALIMAFPYSETHRKYRESTLEGLDDIDYYKESGTDKEDAVWIKQTIHNACGTMALLHAVNNGLPEAFVDPDSPIDEIIKGLKPLNRKGRSDYLENSKALEAYHQEVASQGATEAPKEGEEVEHHYLCFTRSPKSGDLYELDGAINRPIRLGSLEEGEDMLSPKVIDRVKEYMKREGENATYSIIVLAPSFEDE
ncbi:ubiquitin carboxyl-terminal hydrolase Yuh1p [Trichomonascus vanleenenianus]|uniref:ubiquitin carboxyl-terminal hydrolase n=1 Tax=Trichomonascus vanleenenianus TaxID=2268995 RepID=UPI003ECA23C5